MSTTRRSSARRSNWIGYNGIKLSIMERIIRMSISKCCFISHLIWRDSDIRRYIHLFYLISSEMSCCTYSCKFLSPCLVVLHLLALNDGFPWSGLNKNIVFQTSTVYTNLRNIFPSITSRNNFFCSLQIISKSNNCSDSIQTIPYDKNTSRVYVFKDNSIRKTSNQTKKIDSFGSLDEKVKFITSTLLDYDLLNRTIEEWRKPLSKDYISKPLVLVGNWVFSLE